MKLINEIIETLSSQDASLTDALLKTKVLLHKIGHQELTQWVNHELNGYSDADSLPAYRILPVQVLVDGVSMVGQWTSHPIPLMHLDGQLREFLETARLYQSLAVLEKLADKATDGILEMAIPMEMNGRLGLGLRKGVKIQRAWRAIGQADVVSVFVQVRSRLLDFVLALQDQLGENVSDKDLKQRTGSFDAAGLFNNAVFGNNTTIVVGSNNNQRANNLALKGDFSALADELRKHAVQEPDICALEQAIKRDDDAVRVPELPYGPAVKAWLQGMLAKAVDSSWQIELGVASSLLANAI